MAEFFACKYIRQVQFDNWKVQQLECIEQGNRGVCKRARIDDLPLLRVARILHPGDEFAFAVGLLKRQGQPERLGTLPACRFDVGQGCRSVYLRFAETQHIEVGAIENEHP